MQLRTNAATAAVIDQRISAEEAQRIENLAASAVERADEGFAPPVYRSVTSGDQFARSTLNANQRSLFAAVFSELNASRNRGCMASGASTLGASVGGAALSGAPAATEDGPATEVPYGPSAWQALPRIAKGTTLRFRMDASELRSQLSQQVSAPIAARGFDQWRARLVFEGESGNRTELDVARLEPIPGSGTPGILRTKVVDSIDLEVEEPGRFYIELQAGGQTAHISDHGKNFPIALL